MQVEIDPKKSIIGERGVKHFEEKYKSGKAKYVADLCVKDKYGNWGNEPAAIFYQETPPDPNFSNYFAIIVRGNDAYILDGSSAVSEPITGAVAQNGEVIFSAYRNDFKQSKDGSVFIDGGRDYLRTNASNIVAINIVDGKFMLASVERNLKDDQQEVQQEVITKKKKF